MRGDIRQADHGNSGQIETVFHHSTDTELDPKSVPLVRLGRWVGFIVAAFTANHQRVGDLVAKTIVFEHKTRRRYALFIWGCWLVLSLFSLRISENVIHLICRS
jgi:hypothetical protein